MELEQLLSVLQCRMFLSNKTQFQSSRKVFWDRALPVEHVHTPTLCPQSLDLTPAFEVSELPWQQHPSVQSSEMFCPCYQSLFFQLINQKKNGSLKLKHGIIYSNELSFSMTMLAITVCSNDDVMYVVCYICTMGNSWIKLFMKGTFVLYLSNKQPSGWTCWFFTEIGQISLHGIFYYESTTHFL